MLAQGGRGLSPAAFEAAANETGAVVLDVRSKDAFATAHVPRSTFIGLDGNFAPWVGAMIVDVKQPILLVSDQDKVEEAITRLSRVGFDHVLGYFEGGIAEWKKAGMEVDAITSALALRNLPGCARTATSKSSTYANPESTSQNTSWKRSLCPLAALNGHLAEIPAEGSLLSPLPVRLPVIDCHEHPQGARLPQWHQRRRRLQRHQRDRRSVERLRLPFDALIVSRQQHMSEIAA